MKRNQQKHKKQQTKSTNIIIQIPKQNSQTYFIIVVHIEREREREREYTFRITKRSFSSFLQIGVAYFGYFASVWVDVGF